MKLDDLLLHKITTETSLPAIFGAFIATMQRNRDLRLASFWLRTSSSMMSKLWLRRNWNTVTNIRCYEPLNI